jgi:virulence factor Mce-like protein
MRRRDAAFAEFVSPTMVGAITVLVTLVAVFLSYNADDGLPFVPTYDITATVSDSQELVPNNEVLISGHRAGVISSIEAETGSNGRPVARLQLKLNQDLEGQVRTDATVRIRSRSIFGSKILELDPGRDGRPIPPAGNIPLSRQLPNVELDEFAEIFDEETARNLDYALGGLGTGVAGRGIAFNDSVRRLRPLFEELLPVARDLADPGTRLGPLVRDLARTTHEVAPVSERLASLIDSGEVTLAALDAAGPELERTLALSPGTLATGTDALAVLAPVLGKARHITAEIEPGIEVLPSTASQLASALERGTPVLRRGIHLGPALQRSLAELRDLAARTPVGRSLHRLAGLLPRLRPALEYLAPYQTVCNYLALGARNLASTPSEGNAAGNWLRFSAVLAPREMLPSAVPAPQLHFNPYPNGAAPGQPRECEAGNEPYIPGQLLGNVPGNQGTVTELTTPESVAEASD